MSTPITTKEEATQEFLRLVAIHGITWANFNLIPEQDWKRLAEANKFLNTEDRTKALGLDRKPLSTFG